LMDMNSLVDVRALLPRLRVPTLVLHRRNDPLFAPEEAQYIAERIPGAELVMLEGTDHLPCVDPDQILDVIEPFIATASQPAPHLALAAVVAAKGLDAENVVGRLVESGGRIRYSASGDKVVTFDGPATAVRAGLTALDALPDVALGLSIAEIRVDGGPITGSGVEWAVSLARQAPAGQLLVAPMASVLLSGSGIELEPQDVESVKAFRAS